MRYSYVFTTDKIKVPFADRGASIAHCLERARGAVDWLAFADVDEFFDAPTLAPAVAALRREPASAARTPLSAAVGAFGEARVLRIRSQYWGEHGGGVGGERGGAPRAPWDGCESKLSGYIEKKRQKLILRPEFVDYVSVHLVSCRLRLRPGAAVLVSPIMTPP